MQRWRLTFIDGSTTEDNGNLENLAIKYDGRIKKAELLGMRTFEKGTP